MQRRWLAARSRYWHELRIDRQKQHQIKPTGADEVGERFGDVGFRRRSAVADCIGGIADQRQHAGVAKLAQPPLVGWLANDRRRIDLPVAGVQHGAVRSSDGQRIRFRNRMRDRAQFDIERADVEARTERHLGNRNVRSTRFAVALGGQQRSGEWRGKHRHAQLGPQVEHRAIVVLVRVGEHDAGFAPAEDPQIACVVMVENGGNAEQIRVELHKLQAMIAFAEAIAGLAPEISKAKSTPSMSTVSSVDGAVIGGILPRRCETNIRVALDEYRLLWRG